MILYFSKERVKLMKILEIKNNLVKISYDIDDNLALSGFVIIEDTNCPYVAQVVSLKADSPINTAIVKLLFTFDAEGVLKNYNGTIPSLKAAISKLPSNELLDVLPVETPVKLGALAQQGIPLFVDKSIFEHNFIVCCNKQENTNSFIHNMLPQFNSLKQKTVVIDVDGEFDYENKFEFGYDFKLPLNYTTLNYIFDHDLEDVDAKSKAVIQDIFYEVQEYSKTLPLGFIPFNTFLEVVDAQYKETQIPELVLLKNKLLKYKEENVFALNSAELTDLDEEIKHNNISVLNISKVDGDLQKQVISYLYDVMSQVQESVYSIIKLNNYNASKKLIKRFIEGSSIKTTIICGHEFKYLQELKQVAENFVFFAPLTTQHDFAAYNTYLAKLNPEEFVVFGDATQEIPFIAELEEFSQEDLQPKRYIEEPVNPQEPPVYIEDEEKEEEEKEEFAPAQQEPESEIQIQEEQEFSDVSDDEMTSDYYEEPTQIKEDNIENETESIPEIQQAIQPETNQPENSAEILESPEIIDDIVVTPLETEQEVVEPVISDDVSDEESHLINEEQIVRDVDDILYNKKDVDENIPPLEDEEEITEDDLNLIDNLNNAVPAAEGEETALNMEPVIIEDEEELQLSEAEIPEETTPEGGETEEAANTSELTLEEGIAEETPVVPVYPADDIPQVPSQNFEAGDQVSHPKYGTGVVEKMIKYGNKVLCSINFENIGRRLLDPAISEITKL